MTISPDSVLALQRHFLGALTARSRTWLEPLPAERLLFVSNALRAEGDACSLDLGTADSPGEERCSVRVCSRGAARVTVRLADHPPWLTASWAETLGDTVRLEGGDAGAVVEIRAAHDADAEFSGSLRFIVENGPSSQQHELPIRFTARRTHPLARFDFNGSPLPRAHDFGSGDDAYELSVTNETSVPLVVSFADLPAWLTFEVARRQRSGPLAGRFFERTAPFTVKIRPQFFGRHYGSIRVQTNDPRPEMQHLELRFAACIVAAKPYVRAFEPRSIHLRADQSAIAPVRLENWGGVPARTAKKRLSRSIEVSEWPVVPSANGGEPGTTTLPVRIAPAQLPPGKHELSLTLKIEGGDPAEVDVPLRVEVTPAARRGPPVVPEMLGALFALLLLILLFVFVVRGLS